MTGYATLDDIENCMNNGWTDGLPVIPPYGSLVEEMLSAMGWQGADLIGEMPSQSIEIHAEKAAATAVMADLRASVPGATVNTRCFDLADASSCRALIADAKSRSVASTISSMSPRPAAVAEPSTPPTSTDGGRHSKPT